jgi:hypothetical protein
VLHDVRGGGLDQVLTGRGENEQVHVAHGQAGLIERLPRGAHGKVGALLVLGGHAALANARARLDDARAHAHGRTLGRDALLHLQ